MANNAPQKDTPEPKTGTDSTVGAAYKSVIEASSRFLEEVTSAYRDSKTGTDSTKSGTGGAGDGGGLVKTDNGTTGGDGSIATRHLPGRSDGPGTTTPSGDHIERTAPGLSTTSTDGTRVQRDDGGRLTGITRADGSERRFQLDGSGRLVERKSTDTPGAGDLKSTTKDLESVFTGVKKEPGPKYALPDLKLFDSRNPEVNPKSIENQNTTVKPQTPRPEHHPQGRLGDRNIGAKDEVPSDEDQAAAQEVLGDKPITDMMGADQLAVDVAAEIVGGHFENVAAQLARLEGMGPEGVTQLNALARQLGNLLDTDVRSHVSGDGEFSLTFTTAYNAADPTGCWGVEGHESRVTISSDSTQDGSKGTSASTSSFSGYPGSSETEEANVPSELRRLQALATNSLAALPAFMSDNNIDLHRDEY